MEVGFEQVMQILILAAVIFGYWKAHQSFPPKETAELLKRLDGASKQTPNKIDDLLVDLAEFLNDQRRQSGVGVEAVSSTSEEIIVDIEEVTK